MQMRYSAAGFARGTKPTVVDDFMYLPPTPTMDEIPFIVGEMSQGGLLKKILPVLADDPPLSHTAATVMMVLETEYRRQCEFGGDEPWWASVIPPGAQRYMRHMMPVWETYEPLAIMFALPFSGIAYSVAEDGLTEQVMHAFHLFRLSKIKQLAFLQDPIVEKHIIPGYPNPFVHTRWGHSLDVTAVANLIGRNNALPENLLKTLLIAAESHDGLTPAGGDAAKTIDYKAFDEDAHYPELLRRYRHQWEKLRDVYGINRRMLVDTVQGKGVLGSILDIADKVAYVSRDLHAYLCRYAVSTDYHFPAEYQRIKEVVTGHPLATSIWDSVEIENGSVVISDPERLATFLRLRALLFRDLYLNPASRYREFLVSAVLFRYLYNTGQLTRDMLLHMDDEGLSLLFDKAFGDEARMYSLNIIEEPHVEAFDKAEDAYRREEAVLKTKGALAFVENVQSAIKSGTHFLVPTAHGPQSFNDAYPHTAEMIEELCVVPKPYHLYYGEVDRGKMSEKLLKALTAYRMRELRRRKKE